MYKTIVWLSLLFTSLVTAAAETPTVRLGFCNGEVSEVSTLGNNTGATSIEAASVIPASLLSSYEDLEAVGLNVGLASRLNIAGISVWIKENLEGPSIFEAKISKEDGIVKGWNAVEGSAIPLGSDKDIYIGYTLDLSGSSFPVSAVGESRAQGLFVKTGNEWEDLSNAGLGVLSIELIATASNLIPYDLALNNVTVPSIIKIGTAAPLQMKVYNAGANRVTGFTVECAVEGYDPFDIEVERTIQPYESADVEVEFISPVDHKTDSAIMTVTITGLDDGEDADTSNNSFATTLSMQRFDFAKKLLIEEFSTERCTYCPRGAAVLHDILAEPDFEGKVLAIAHHAGFNTDWLTIPASSTYLWFYDGGAGNTYAPAFMYDRYSFDGQSPVNGATENYANIKAKVAERLAVTPMTALEATASFNSETSILKVHVEGERRKGYTGDRLTICVVEDNITARMQAGTTGTFIHQHVLRNVSEVWGTEIDWNDLNEFDLDHDVYINPSWVKENLHVIAFISTYDQTNYKNCTVDNAEAVSGIEWGISGIDTPVDNSDISDIEYYTLDGLRVKTPVAGLYIVRRDGHVTKEYIR